MVGLSAAVVCFGAASVPVSGRAQADPIGTAQAQQAALQAQVMAGATRIRALTVAYEEALTQESTLAAQVTADRSRISELQGRVDSTRQALRTDAILSYTGATATTPSGGSAADDPAIRAEYMAVAAGDVTDTVDRYRAAQAQVAAAERSLTVELDATAAAARASQSARQQAVALAQSVQAQLARVQTQLTQLVAARAAAQAAAQAAAARSAAEAAAAARSQTQGLPVSGGLVTVVHNIVSPPPPAPAGGAGGVWLQLRECESGDNYQADTGNGFFGAYQFSESTWTGMGYPGRPDLEPPAMQDQAAQRLQAQSGWGQWPACSAALGLS